jgi:hypothetical protein
LSTVGPRTAAALQIPVTGKKSAKPEKLLFYN